MQSKYSVCINVYGSGQYVIGWSYSLTKVQWEEVIDLAMRLDTEDTNVSSS